jgi:hypothetical protein
MSFPRFDIVQWQLFDDPKRCTQKVRDTAHVLDRFHERHC